MIQTVTCPHCGEEAEVKMSPRGRAQYIEARDCRCVLSWEDERQMLQAAKDGQEIDRRNGVA